MLKKNCIQVFTKQWWVAKKGLICLILFKLLFSFAGQRITAKDEEGYEQPLNGAEYHGQNAAALNAHSQVNISFSCLKD